MPSEPDHAMDAWLKAYAKRKREEAGDDWEMHPATRRLLQSEVARVHGSPDAPRSSRWSWLILGWPRLMAACSILIVLIAVMVGTGVFDGDQEMNIASVQRDDLPAGPEAIEAEAAKKEKKPFDTTANEPAMFEDSGSPTEAILANPAPATTAPSKAVEGVEGNRQQAQHSSPKELGAPPAPTAAQQNRAAGSGSEPRQAAPLMKRKVAANDEARAEDATRLSSNLAEKPRSRALAAPANPGSLEPRSAPAAESKSVEPTLAPAVQPQTSTSVVRGNRLDSGADAFYKQASVADLQAPKNPNVVRFEVVTNANTLPVASAVLLKSFQFQETVSGCRVIDSDGSVYQGRFTTGSGAEEDDKRQALGGAAQTRVRGNADEENEKAVAVTSERSAVNRVLGRMLSGTHQQPITFIVSGTNRSSGKRVVLQGSLVPAQARSNVRRTELEDGQIVTRSLAVSQPAPDGVVSSAQPLLQQSPAETAGKDANLNLMLQGTVRVNGGAPWELRARPK